jgi:hypothetical protein
MTEVIDRTLTDLQVRVYRYIRDYFVEHGFGPLQADIRRETECSVFGVHTALKALRARNHIVYEKFTERGIAPVDTERHIRREAPNAWDRLRGEPTYETQ